MYLLTVHADSDGFIFVTNGFTVTLLMLPKGRSPISGRIHLFRAASILEVSLMGSRSRVPTHPRYAFACSRNVTSPRTTRLKCCSEFAPERSTSSRAIRRTAWDGGLGRPFLSSTTGATFSDMLVRSC